MQALALAGGMVALIATVGFGLIAHEFAHAIVLSYFEITYVIRWFPGNHESPISRFGVPGSFATVTPQSIPEDVPAWGLKLSALAPLALALPFLLVLAGVVPDPVGTDNYILTSMVVGWLACAIPSPQDFALVWNPQAVAERTSWARTE